MKKTSKRKLIKKIDKVFSEIVRSRGSCERCGKRENLQCAHIFSRRIMRLRWYLDNALCLDYKCHIFWAHRNPIEFTRFVENKLGKEKFENLERMSIEIVHYKIDDLEKIYIDLKNYTKPKLEI